MIRSSSKIERIADSVVNSHGSSYIHDPQHTKRVPAGYHKTNRGWSNNPLDGMKETLSQSPSPVSNSKDVYKGPKYGQQLNDVQRAEYPPITIERGNGLPPITSTFIGVKDSPVNRSEAYQINKASELFQDHMYKQEALFEDNPDVATYVEDEIPRAMRRGNKDIVEKQSWSFHPSEDVTHNLKFFEFLDGINPSLSQKLLDQSYIAPHEQTPQSLEIAKANAYFDNGDLKRKTVIG
jgi:hypothetical protein